MNDYEVLPRTASDLFQAVEYTRKHWGEAQVDHLREVFDRAIQNIILFPEIGRPRSDLLPGMRTMPVLRFHLFYVLEGTTVVVVRFIHQSRSLEELMFDE